MSENLLEKLERYGASDFYPLHMPGHKRRISLFGDPFAIDITEIDGFDDLHNAQGILLEAQRRAARLYGAEETYYLVNGSTCGILSAVSASVARGGRLLLARNSHRSCYHAAFLNDLRVTYVCPPVAEISAAGAACGLCGSIRPEDVREALRRHPDIQAVLVTSPTYDGVVSDIGAIAEAAHAAGAVLIVDEAHGAHFGMHSYFPERALAHGADIVINSLHKTLPSLTQTALLHVQGERADREKLRSYLDIYQTSSPSYILMAGMDACVRLLEEQGEELFASFVTRLEQMRDELRRKLRVLRLVDGSELSTIQENGQSQTPANSSRAGTGGTRQNLDDLKYVKKSADGKSPGGFGYAKLTEHALIYDFDRSKVLISTAAVSGEMVSAVRFGQTECFGSYAADRGAGGIAMSGSELAAILREKYHLEPEMAAADYVTAIMTVADTQEGFDRLTAALLEIDAALADGRKGVLSFSGNCADSKVDRETDQDKAESDGSGDENADMAGSAEGTRYPANEEVLTIRQALESPVAPVPLADSAGQVSAEYVYLYPPGIPLLVPGERISEELLQRLERERNAGLALRGMADESGRAIRVVMEATEMRSVS